MVGLPPVGLLMHLLHLKELLENVADPKILFQKSPHSEVAFAKELESLEDSSSHYNSQMYSVQFLSRFLHS